MGKGRHITNCIILSLYYMAMAWHIVNVMQCTRGSAQESSSLFFLVGILCYNTAGEGHGQHLTILHHSYLYMA